MYAPTGDVHYLYALDDENNLFRIRASALTLESTYTHAVSGTTLVDFTLSEDGAHAYLAYKVDDGSAAGKVTVLETQDMATLVDTYDGTADGQLSSSAAGQCTSLARPDNGGNIYVAYDLGRVHALTHDKVTGTLAFTKITVLSSQKYMQAKEPFAAEADASFAITKVVANANNSTLYILADTSPQQRVYEVDVEASANYDNVMTIKEENYFDAFDRVNAIHVGIDGYLYIADKNTPQLFQVEPRNMRVLSRFTGDNRAALPFPVIDVTTVLSYEFLFLATSNGIVRVDPRDMESKNMLVNEKDTSAIQHLASGYGTGAVLFSCTASPTISPYGTTKEGSRGRWGLVDLRVLAPLGEEGAQGSDPTARPTLDTFSTDLSGRSIYFDGGNGFVYTSDNKGVISKFAKEDVGGEPLATYTHFPTLKGQTAVRQLLMGDGFLYFCADDGTVNRLDPEDLSFKGCGFVSGESINEKCTALAYNTKTKALVAGTESGRVAQIDGTGEHLAQMGKKYTTYLDTEANGTSHFIRDDEGGLFQAAYMVVKSREIHKLDADLIKVDEYTDLPQGVTINAMKLVHDDVESKTYLLVALQDGSVRQIKVSSDNSGMTEVYRHARSGMGKIPIALGHGKDDGDNLFFYVGYDDGVLEVHQNGQIGDVKVMYLPKKSNSASITSLTDTHAISDSPYFFVGWSDGRIQQFAFQGAVVDNTRDDKLIPTDSPYVQVTYTPSWITEMSLAYAVTALKVSGEFILAGFAHGQVHKLHVDTSAGKIVLTDALDLANAGTNRDLRIQDIGIDAFDAGLLLVGANVADPDIVDKFGTARLYYIYAGKYESETQYTPMGVVYQEAKTDGPRVISTILHPEGPGSATYAADAFRMRADIAFSNNTVKSFEVVLRDRYGNSTDSLLDFAYVEYANQIAAYQVLIGGANAVIVGNDGYVYIGIGTEVHRVDPNDLSRPVGIFTGHSGNVTALAYTDTDRLMTGGADGRIYEVFPDTMEANSMDNNNGGTVNALIWGGGPDGALFSAGADETVRKYVFGYLDVASYEGGFIEDNVFDSVVWDFIRCKFDSNSNSIYVVVGRSRETTPVSVLYKFNVSDGDSITLDTSRTINYNGNGFSGGFTIATLDDENTYIFVGFGASGDIIRYNANDLSDVVNEKGRIFSGHTRSRGADVRDIFYSDDGSGTKWMFSTSSDSTVRKWNPNTMGDEQGIFTTSTFARTLITYAEHGFVGDNNGNIYKIDLQNMTRIGNVYRMSNAVWNLAATTINGENYLFANDASGNFQKIKINGENDMEKVSDFENNLGNTQPIVIDGDNNILVPMSDGDILVVDSNSFTLIRRITSIHTNLVHDIDIDINNRTRFYSASWDDTVKIIDFGVSFDAEYQPNDGQILSIEYGNNLYFSTSNGSLYEIIPST